MDVDNLLEQMANYIKALEFRIEELENDGEVPFDGRIHQLSSLIPVKVSVYEKVTESYAKWLAMPKETQNTQKYWAETIADRHGIKIGQVMDIAKNKYDIRRYIKD